MPDVTSNGKAVLHKPVIPASGLFTGAVFPAVIDDIRRTKFGDLEVKFKVPLRSIDHALPVMHSVLPVVVSVVPWNPAELSFEEATDGTGDDNA